MKPSFMRNHEARETSQPLSGHTKSERRTLRAAFAVNAIGSLAVYSALVGAKMWYNTSYAHKAADHGIGLGIAICAGLWLVDMKRFTKHYRKTNADIKRTDDYRQPSSQNTIDSIVAMGLRRREMGELVQATSSENTLPLPDDLGDKAGIADIIDFPPIMHEFPDQPA